MNGTLPTVPGEQCDIQGTDECWLALMVIRDAGRIRSTLKSNGHEPSVTSGPETHECFFDDNRTKDDTGGLSAMECIEEYFRWMAEIWIQVKSRNLFRLDELKAKYSEVKKAYQLYRQVCRSHNMVLRPSLTVEGDDVVTISVAPSPDCGVRVPPQQPAPKAVVPPSNQDNHYPAESSRTLSIDAPTPPPQKQ